MAGLSREDLVRSCGRNIDWENENDRRVLLRKIFNIIRRTNNHEVLSLRAIFSPEEIDRIIFDCVNWRKNNYIRPGNRIIKFLADSGYKDVPDIDENGKPREHRTTPIHTLFKDDINNKDSVIQDLFQIFNRCDVNYINESGVTHFHVAAMFGMYEVVERFLEHRHNPNLIRTNEGYSPLHYAILHNRDKVVRLLLENGADPNLTTNSGYTSLHIYFLSDLKFRVLKTIFQISRKINQLVLVDLPDVEGDTPLHMATEKRSKKTIECLLRNGADPNLTDSEGFTFLHLLCQKRHFDDLVATVIEITEKMEKTANVNAQSLSGDTPLHLAMRCSSFNGVINLLTHGADPNLPNNEGSTPLHIICNKSRFNDQKSFIEVLFQYTNAKYFPLKINMRDNLGNTPFHLALGSNNSEVLEILLSNGADPTLTDNEGSTPLHILSNKPMNQSSLQLLLNFFAENNYPPQSNARDSLGNTPLHLATRHNSRNLVDMLLRGGADPNLTDEGGSTPLHVICRTHRRPDVAKQFFQTCDDIGQMVEIDARDGSNRTPLQWAVSILALGTIDVLLSRGANLSSFVFPDVTYFGQIFQPIRDLTYNPTLKIASGILAIAEHIAGKAYELNQNEALKIMHIFDHFELFHTVPRRSIRGGLEIYYDRPFLKRCKRKWVGCVTIYELIKFKREDAAKGLTTMDYFNFADTDNFLSGSPADENKVNCSLLLCERLAKGFFCNWTLEPFRKLVRTDQPLPTEICLRIFKRLKNKDLCNICFVVEEQGL